MQFSEFSTRIVKVKKMQLPGEEFHLKMAPIERLLELKNQAREAKTAKRAGVLCLFYPSSEGETRFMLILRKTYKGVHSAQIGFPGGKVEPDDTSIEMTALRETEEEVGVPTQDISVLKKLTEIYIPPSNFFVQPFIGIAESTPQFKAQESEVEALVEVPLAEFLNDEVCVQKSLKTSYAEEIKVPAFELQGHIVWGATAMMLNEVRALLIRTL
jgi:8-oxo-dGTP pyrophosphatase MutT (NUDIX family)